MRLLGLARGAVLSISQPFEHTANACSCGDTQLALVGPTPEVAAPLNTKVRPEAPSATGASKSSTCQVAGRWVVFDGVKASDPDRPDAQLAYALGITLPPSGVMLLGIAALDEAGNASAMRPVRVDLTVARVH